MENELEILAEEVRMRIRAESTRFPPQGSSVNRLKEVLGDKGYATWLKRRGSNLGSAVIEQQAENALVNMQQAAEKKVKWNKLCEELKELVESPDTFFGDEEEVEEERDKARKHLAALEKSTTTFPLFRSRSARHEETNL